MKKEIIAGVMLVLIFSYGNIISMMDQDIYSH